MAEIRYSPYQLLPQGPSATQWLIEDAAKLPEKLMRRLEAAGKILVGQPNLGETYQIEGLKWVNDPDFAKAANNELVARNLEVAWIVTKHSAGQNKRLRHRLTIPGIPFPNTKGAYAYGAEEYFATALLRQKNGIFPVSSEARKNAEKTPEILWETPLATFLQNGENLLIQTRKKTGEGENTPVAIPSRLWGELAETLERYRTKANTKVNFSLLPQEGSELRELIRNSLGYETGESVDFQMDRFFQAAADERVPLGSWAQRLETLSEAYPQLAEHFKTLQTERRWTVASARAAQTLTEEMPAEEFLPVGHMGRLYVQTATDILANYLYAEIRQAFQEARTHSQKRENKSLTLENPWVRRSWARDMTKLFLSPAMPWTIDEASTPKGEAIKANLLKHDFQPFAPESYTNAPSISDIERAFHPSALGFIAVATPESGNVGVDHWLCAGARRNAETGEVEKPIMVRGADGTFTRQWMNSETFEKFERQLADKNLGVHFGRPNLQAPEARLWREFQLTGICKPSEVPAYLDYVPADMLPIHLGIEGIENIAAARSPMAHAAQSNARTVNGSEAPKTLSEETKRNLSRLTNIGVMLVAPASGVVTKLHREDGLHILTIQDEKGDAHICEIPVGKANAFKAIVGSTPYMKVGDKVTAGTVIAGPDHHAYRVQVAGKEPTALHSTVNLKGIYSSQGIEDQMAVSSYVVASGRLDQSVTEKEATERPDFPIYVKKFMPGSLIRPNEVLAFQIVEGKQVPIVTGPNQGGILQKVTLVQDTENPIGGGTPVHVDEEAFVPPSLREIIDQELREDLQRVFDLRQRLDPNYLKEMQARGIDLLPCLESFEATYMRDGSLQKVSLPLSELAPGHAGRDMLIDLLSNPENQLNIEKKPYLNERIYYTQQRINSIRDLLGSTTPRQEIPHFAKNVVFEIQRVVRFENGSKFSNDGVKGVIHTSDYMPPLADGQRFIPAELSKTMHGVFARGAVKTQEQQKNLSYLRNLDGTISAVEVMSFDAVENVQKAAPQFSNKNFANPTQQGRDFRGGNRDGTNRSAESAKHAASMDDLYKEGMIEPSTPEIARLERTSRGILIAGHHEIARLSAGDEPAPQIEMTKAEPMLEPAS